MINVRDYIILFIAWKPCCKWSMLFALFFRLSRFFICHFGWLIFSILIGDARLQKENRWFLTVLTENKVLRKYIWCIYSFFSIVLCYFVYSLSNLLTLNQLLNFEQVLVLKITRFSLWWSRPVHIIYRPFVSKVGTFFHHNPPFSFNNLGALTKFILSL